MARPKFGRSAQAIDDRAGRQQPSALEPGRQDDRFCIPSRRLRAGLAIADRRRRTAAVDQAAHRRLRPPLVSPGRQDRLYRRGLPRANARADRGQGQGEGSLQEKGPHLRSLDDPSLDHLGRGEAQPPVRRRCQDRRGQGPDSQARGQHPPCPVRRLVRLRLVARRQGARLHRRANQNAAWSTNTDIWTVPVEGGEPKNVTAGNAGADAQPAYSPDGVWLAYVSQARRRSSRTSGSSRSSVGQPMPATS